MDIKVGEFLCPMCRQLSNALIPFQTQHTLVSSTLGSPTSALMDQLLHLNPQELEARSSLTDEGGAQADYTQITCIDDINLLNCMRKLNENTVYYSAVLIC